MAAELFVPPSKALDANANPYAGAKWFFYATGTTTPQSVYTTAALSVAHANPVVADSSGKFANIFFDEGLIYRGILKNADESVTLHDIDPVNIGFGNSSGAEKLGFSHAETYSSGTSGKHMKGTVFVTDAPYNATADGVANDYAAFLAAYTESRYLQLPYGTYKINTVLETSAPVSVVSDDWRTKITNKGIFINASNNRGGLLQGFGMEGPNDGTGTGVKITNGQDINLMLRKVEKFQYGADLNYSFICRFFGGEFSFNTTGVRLKNFSNGIGFYGTNISNNTGDGVEVQSCQQVNFIGCDIESNGGWGIAFDNSDNATLQNRGHLVLGGYVESAAPSSPDGDFYIGRTSNAVLTEDVTLQNVMHLGTKPYGYYVDYARGTKIINPVLGSAVFTTKAVYCTANSQNTTLIGIDPSLVTVVSGGTVSIQTIQKGTTSIALDGTGFGDATINFPWQYFQEPHVTLTLSSDSNPSGSLGTVNIKNGVGTTGVYVQVVGGPASATVKVNWRAGL